MLGKDMKENMAKKKATDILKGTSFLRVWIFGQLRVEKEKRKDMLQL